MTERTITLAEARRILTSLTEQSPEETLVITSHGQPCLTLMSYHAHREMLANLESLQTVLEIMLGGAGAEHPRPPRTARPALVNDKSTSWEEFKEEVGWE
ncbi:MAG TPA: hypothetical protein VF458_03245 [Ktedonobacteraceae bacterium]